MAKQKGLDEILGLIESVADDDDVRGVFARYRDRLATGEGADALVARLDQRRDDLRRWEGIGNLIKRVHMQDAADTRHELETATSKVIQSQDPYELAKVAAEYPVIFTGTFISTLIDLQKEASAAGEVETVRLVNNRLKHLQLLQLANLQGIRVDPETFRKITYQVLEARSLADLFDRFLEYPVTFSEAFDSILRELAREAATNQADPTLPRVAELRIDVLTGLRKVVESFVHQRQATGGPDAAVEALGRAKQADQFLAAVAEYPFVLGEDFADLMRRELERARTEADASAVKGLERRMAHLDKIGQIVAKLTSDPADSGGSGNGANGSSEQEVSA